MWMILRFLMRLPIAPNKPVKIDYFISATKTEQRRREMQSLYMANVYYNRVKPEDSTYSRCRRNIFFIGRSIGSWFNPDDLPVTADFMANVWRDASYFIWSLKFGARIRPFYRSGYQNLEVTDWAAYPKWPCLELIHQCLHLFRASTQLTTLLKMLMIWRTRVKFLVYIIPVTLNQPDICSSVCEYGFSRMRNS